MFTGRKKENIQRQMIDKIAEVNIKKHNFEDIIDTIINLLRTACYQAVRRKSVRI